MLLIPGPLNQALECPAGEIRLPKEMDLGSEFDKHTPAHKCFALNDLRNRVVYNPALPGPEATGQRWVYMIGQFRMILSFILKKKE